MALLTVILARSFAAKDRFDTAVAILAPFSFLAAPVAWSSYLVVLLLPMVLVFRFDKRWFSRLVLLAIWLFVLGRPMNPFECTTLMGALFYSTAPVLSVVAIAVLLATQHAAASTNRGEIQKPV